MGRLRVWLSEQGLERLARNVMLVVSGKGGASGINFATLAITAHALGATEFGFLTLVKAYTNGVRAVINLNPWQAVVRFGAMARSEDRQDTLPGLLKLVLIVDALTALAAAVVAAVGAVFAARLFGWDPSQKLATALYALCILPDLSGLSVGTLRLFDRFDRLARVDVAGAGLLLLLSIAAFLGGSNAFVFLGISAFVRATVSGALLWSALREVSRQRYPSLWTASMWGVKQDHPGLWPFLWNTSLTTSFKSLRSEADSLVVGAILDEASVGLLRAARSVGALPSKLLNPMGLAIYPELAELNAQQKWHQLRRVVVLTTAALIAVAVLIWAVGSLFRDSIVALCFGADFLRAAPLLVVTLGVPVLGVAFAGLQRALVALGKAGVVLRVTIGSTVLFFVALFTMVEQWGIMGAALSYAVPYAVLLVYLWVAYRDAMSSVSRIRSGTEELPT